MRRRSGHPGDDGSRRTNRTRVALAIALAGAACLAAGCGGSPATAAATPHQRAVAWAQCLRSHGEPRWPDPDSAGSFNIAGPDVNRAQFTQAITACRNLAPAGKVPTGAQFHAAEAVDLKTAACMRFHGIPNFPDPAVLGTGQAVGFQAGPNRGIDTRSPQFRSAWHLCQQRYPSPEFAAPAGAP